MSLKIDRVQLEIVIGNDKARKRMLELDDAIRKNVRSMGQMKRANQENTEAYKQLENETKQYRLEQDRLIDKIGILNLTKKELTKRSRELSTILANLRPNTTAFTTYNAQLELVTNRLRDLRGASSAASNSVNRLGMGFSQAQVFMAGFMAVVLSIGFQVRSFANDIGLASDKIGEVMKTTGLTKAEIRELRDEFQDFDTRTAVQQLEDYAYQAGKLGMKGKEEIKGFVKEADIAVVSLGKSLGNSAEETINTLGQIIGSFGLEQTMGWELAMRHTGALINELGKSSTANEANIVNYMARLASAGVSLKIPVSNIAAIGATLDSLKVPAEQGSTAVQKFLFVIASESDKLSKFLGISKTKYESMVEQDIMGVMDLLLRTAKSGNTGLFKMVQQLDSMDVSGVRMINTVSQLVNNVDKLSTQVGIAEAEFEKGTSTLNEYTIMNTTAGAEMDKTGREVADLAYQVGAKLEPSLISILQWLRGMLKWLKDNGAALLFLGKIIATAVIAFVSYNAAIRLASANTWLNVIATKAATLASTIYRGVVLLLSATYNLLTGNIQRSAAAMRLFNMTLKSNPIGLAVSLITTAIAAFTMFSDTVGEASAETQQLTKDFAKERAGLELLIFQAQQAYTNKKLYASKISEINQKYGEYLPKLLDEKTSLVELNKAHKDIIVTLEQRMRSQALFNQLLGEEEKIVALEIKRIAIIDKIAERQRQQSKAMEQALKAPSAAQNNLIVALGNDIRNFNKELSDLDEQLAGLGQKKTQILDLLYKNPQSIPQKPILNITPDPNLTDEDKRASALHAAALVDQLRRDLDSSFVDFGPLIPRNRIQEINDEIEELFPDADAEYLAEKWKQTWDGRMAMLEVQYNSELISYAEFLDKKAALELEKETETAQKREAVRDAYLGGAAKLISAYSDFQTAAMNRELENAGENEAKKEAIRRKYAKRQQGADIMAAVINQAKGITEIWGKWAWNPVVAQVLTGIELLATGAQIALIKSQQFATGRYNVKGASDNNTYSNVPYLGAASTGIVYRPALVAERGSEGIIDHKTLYSKARDHMGMTSMDHFKAISAIRYNTTMVRQFADGRYVATSTADNATQGNANTELARQNEMLAAMLAYMQRVDTWQQNLTVKNDPRETMDEYAKFINTQNRATGG